jgi:hypothetical protein
VCEGDNFGTMNVYRCMSSVPLLKMEAQPLKDVEKAVIHRYVMLSAL